MIFSSGKRGFTSNEKREHYSKVADGTIAPKKGSKYSAKEQTAYARGQRDARNEEARNFAYKNATPEQRKAYKEKQKADRAAFNVKKSKKK